MEAFQIIEGNIKQQMLPFVLNPDATLNKPGTGFTASSDPQYFTYKSNSRYMWSGKAELNFCPTTIKRNFDKDIANQLLYNSDGTKDPVTFANIINTIPGVQIREFLPDTALDQLINFFTGMIKGVMQLFGSNGISLNTKVEKTKLVNGKKEKLSDKEIAAAEADQQTNLFKRIGNVAKEVLKYCVGTTGDPSLIKAIALGEHGSAINNVYQSNQTVSDKIVEFPYMLYYQLQSCTTTNIYEIPAIKNDNIMYSSNGSGGWNTAEGGFKLINKTVQNIPVVGNFLSKMLGSIGINWMPYWDPISGTATSEPEVTIEFDLFNDDLKTTINNFIFVNTLIANNKWIQSGLFSHSAHLYDVKLEGYNRLFACTGKFDVKKIGILRMPPPIFFKNDKQNPLLKYINSNLNKDEFLARLKTDKSVMIPDVYHVTMTFSSILPANFNTYLYTLVANRDPIERYYTHTYDKSIGDTLLPNAIEGLINHVKKTWESTK